MQFGSYFLFWLIIITIPIILAPIFLLFLEKKKIKEALQQTYSWLKERSQKIYIDKAHVKKPKIVAELKPELQVDRVEVTTFPIGTFTSPRAGLLFFLPRNYFSISGTKDIESPIKFIITGRDPMSATIAWSEYKQGFETGDPVFDRRYMVKGEDFEEIPKILSDSKFRSYILRIYDLIKFEVRGNRHISFSVKCNPDMKSVENSILAMKRIIEILSETS